MLVPQTGKDARGGAACTAFGRVSLILLLLCLSGVAWAGIWGGSSFSLGASSPPANGGSNRTRIRRADPQAMLNDGKTKEVPWILELAHTCFRYDGGRKQHQSETNR